MCDYASMLCENGLSDHIDVVGEVSHFTRILKLDYALGKIIPQRK